MTGRTSHFSFMGDWCTYEHDQYPLQVAALVKSSVLLFSSVKVER